MENLLVPQTNNSTCPPLLVQEKDKDPTRRYHHVQEETKPIKTQPNGRVSGGSARNRDEMQKKARNRGIVRQAKA